VGEIPTSGEATGPTKAGGASPTGPKAPAHGRIPHVTIGPRARIAIAAIFFTYILAIRTYDITSTFLMLGDQIRDWTIALGSWRDLPLTGPPSVAGGRTLGPIYYWVLWLGRVTAGPFTDNLPHTGGLIVSLLQGVGDTWLLWVLMTRLPITLALAASLLAASAPFDVGLSGTIWNPPVAAALAKMAMALVLTLGKEPAWWRLAATAGTAWLAVQAHSTGAFVGVPILAALIGMPLVERQWRRAGQVAALAIGVIAILQVPYLVAQFRAPDTSLAPTMVIESFTQASSVDVVKSYSTVTDITGGLLVRQLDTWKLRWPTLVVIVIVLARWRQDLPLLAASVGGLATAGALFATWTHPYDSYWFMTLTMSMALAYVLAIAALPWPRVAQAAGAILLAAVVWWQPMRIAQSRLTFKFPEYRAMLAGSRSLAAQAPVLRDIRITFAVHPSMDKYFMYKILGGRMDRNAPHTAFIEADGRVRIE